MLKLRVFAVAGLFLFSSVGVASAAVIDVTYEITGGTVNLVALPQANVATGFATIRYSGGSPALSGSLSTGAISLLSWYVTFVTPVGVPLPGGGAFTIPGFGVYNAVPGFLLGSGAATLSGPLSTYSGNITGFLTAAGTLLPGGISNLNGNGTKQGGSFGFGVVGSEVARAVPEPNGTAMLLTGLAGLGSFAALRRHRTRA